MPQTNGIAISSGASLAYFILTFITLFILYIQYEIVNFGYRNTLQWWRVVSGLYGLTLIILGAIELGLELSDQPNIVSDIWATLSSNQKLYFDNDVDNLQAERT